MEKGKYKRKERREREMNESVLMVFKRQMKQVEVNTQRPQQLNSEEEREDSGRS